MILVFSHILLPPSPLFLLIEKSPPPLPEPLLASDNPYQISPNRDKVRIQSISIDLRSQSQVRSTQIRYPGMGVSGADGTVVD